MPTILRRQTGILDSRSEPASLIETVRAVRGKYPVKITDNQAGAIVNEIAWMHQGQGWALARKPTGAHAVQIRTGFWISRDLLIHTPTALMYDVLSRVSDGVGNAQWSSPQPRDLVAVDAVAPEGQVTPEGYAKIYLALVEIEHEVAKIRADLSQR